MKRNHGREYFTRCEGWATAYSGNAFVIAFLVLWLTWGVTSLIGQWDLAAVVQKAAGCGLLLLISSWFGLTGLGTIWHVFLMLAGKGRPTSLGSLLLLVLVSLVGPVFLFVAWSLGRRCVVAALGFAGGVF